MGTGAIKTIKTNEKFKEYHEGYCGLCGKSGTLEKDLYPVLMKTTNAVLDVVSGPDIEGIPSKQRQYYHVKNRPSRKKKGSLHWRSSHATTRCVMEGIYQG